jgi:hypothetical protein
MPYGETYNDDLGTLRSRWKSEMACPSSGRELGWVLNCGTSVGSENTVGFEYCGSAANKVRMTICTNGYKYKLNGLRLFIISRLLITAVRVTSARCGKVHEAA